MTKNNNAVDTAVEVDTSDVSVTHSPTFCTIAKKMIEFQNECSKIVKDGTNPHFNSRFATLENVIDGTKPLLCKLGLYMQTNVVRTGDGNYLETFLIDTESGEWFRSVHLLDPAKPKDPQFFASCITYARRYIKTTMLDLATTDDDGNESSGRGSSNRPAFKASGSRSVPDGPVGNGKPASDKAAVGANPAKVLLLGKAQAWSNCEKGRAKDVAKMIVGSSVTHGAVGITPDVNGQITNDDAKKIVDYIDRQIEGGVSFQDVFQVALGGE